MIKPKPISLSFFLSLSTILGSELRACVLSYIPRPFLFIYSLNFVTESHSFIKLPRLSFHLSLAQY